MKTSSSALSVASRDALGFAGGAVLALSLTPQIIKLILTRSAADMSLMWSLLYLLGNTLSFIYLLSIGALAAWIPVAAELLGCTITIALKLLYDHTNWGRAQQQQRQQQQFKQWQEQYLEALKLGQDTTGVKGTSAVDDTSHQAMPHEVFVTFTKSGRTGKQAAAAAAAAAAAVVDSSPRALFKGSHRYWACSTETGLSEHAPDPAGLSAAAATAAAAAYSYASFTMMQSKQAGHWYSQPGISHTALVPAAATGMQCCYICGAPQLPSRSTISQAGSTGASSLPGVRLLGSVYQSFSAAFRHKAAGGSSTGGGGGLEAGKSSKLLSSRLQDAALATATAAKTRSEPGLNLQKGGLYSAAHGAHYSKSHGGCAEALHAQQCENNALNGLVASSSKADLQVAVSMHDGHDAGHNSTGFSPTLDARHSSAGFGPTLDAGHNSTGFSGRVAGRQVGQSYGQPTAAIADLSGRQQQLSDNGIASSNGSCCCDDSKLTVGVDCSNPGSAGGGNGPECQADSSSISMSRFVIWNNAVFSNSSCRRDTHELTGADQPLTPRDWQ